MSRVFSVSWNDYLSAKSIVFILTLLTRRRKKLPFSEMLLFKQFFFQISLKNSYRDDTGKMSK